MCVLEHERKMMCVPVCECVQDINMCARVTPGSKQSARQPVILLIKGRPPSEHNSNTQTTLAFPRVFFSPFFSTSPSPSFFFLPWHLSLTGNANGKDERAKNMIEEV